MFTHKYRYAFALLLSVYTFLNTEFCNVYEYFNLRIEWYYAFLTITAITFLILEGNKLVEPFIRSKVPPEKYKKKFPFVFFIAGNFIATFVACIIVLLMGMVLHRYSFTENIIPLKLNLTYAWLVNLLYHLINTVIFYFKEYRSTQVEAEELKRFHAQAELQLVKNQINPHFLFNNLNVLSSLVMQNNAEANRFIEEFSKVYRYILTNQEKELVALKTELYFIDPYIFLLKKRFGDGLKVTIDVPDKMGELLIIPAALQMLIENAIKHNVVSKQKPLHISLHISNNNCIVVTNNLQAKQTIEKSTEIGLQNIIKRYRLVSRQDVSVNKDIDSFIVTLPLISAN
ncbi:MAG: histidine kinase [Sphingobacteriales bacterium]|jgi:LytS/YehU family sensor histidine kinase|nr:histidine kinase [Sphingobacteriales bacterium]